MSVNDELSQLQSEEESASIINVGAVLAQARESLGISIEDAAQQLRLSARQLHALEANDYSGLPGATFIRGFIRNYARLLRLDPEPLLHALGAQASEPVRHAITLQSEDIAISQRDKRMWLPYIVASGIVGILLVSWVMYMDYRDSHPAAKNADVVTQTAPAQAAGGGYSPEQVTLPGVNVAAEVSPQPQPQPQPVPEPPVVAKPKPMPVAEPAVPAVTPASAVRPAAVTTAGAARLKLVFSQQSWVRVFDRDGKEIFHKNGAAGTEDTAEGMPPLKVEVGNAAGVQITFNDKPVDLAPHTKANVARFSLE